MKKLLGMMFLFCYIFAQQNDTAVKIYTKDEYQTFTYIMLISDVIWDVINQKERGWDQHNTNVKKAVESCKKYYDSYQKDISFYGAYLSEKFKLAGLLRAPRDSNDLILFDMAFNEEIMMQVQDVRESWPCFDTSCEKTDAGFFLEFSGDIPTMLWTCWGKLRVTGSFIEDPELNIKNKIIEKLSAVKFDYGSDYDVYILHRIVDKKMDLPKAKLTDKSIQLEDNFIEKWVNMHQDYNQEFKIQPLKYPRRTSDQPANRIIRNSGGEKPVLSLQHLATPTIARKSAQPPWCQKPDQPVQSRSIPLSSLLITYTRAVIFNLASAMLDLIIRSHHD